MVQLNMNTIKSTILGIKKEIGLDEISFNQAKDENGNKFGWFRAWDDEKRIAVYIRKELLGEIKANARLDGLYLKRETKDSESGAYELITILK